MRRAEDCDFAGEILTDLDFRAELTVVAASGTQAEVEASAAIRAIRQLGAERCLEALTVRCVEMQPRLCLENEAGDRRGGVVRDVAAVVAVRAGDEVILGVELHFASTYTDGGGPGVREIPRALRVLVEVRADVVLVTTQVALHAERRADEIVVALTQLVLPVVAQPDDP